jgi:hypothetical protein
MPDAIEFLLYLAAFACFLLAAVSVRAPLGRPRQPDRPRPGLLGVHPPGGRPQTGQLNPRSGERPVGTIDPCGW